MDILLVLINQLIEYYYYYQYKHTMMNRYINIKDYLILKYKYIKKNFGFLKKKKMEKKKEKR